jgi:hypothetical protein
MCWLRLFDQSFFEACYSSLLKWLILLTPLRENLKRKYYPVQCEQYYTTFKIKGNNRSAAVAELEKHRQFDEACPKRSPTMKGGMSEAQWTGSSEENHSRNSEG